MENFYYIELDGRYMPYILAIHFHVASSMLSTCNATRTEVLLLLFSMATPKTFIVKAPLYSQNAVSHENVYIYCAIVFYKLKYRSVRKILCLVSVHNIFLSTVLRRLMLVLKPLMIENNEFLLNFHRKKLNLISQKRIIFM